MSISPLQLCHSAMHRTIGPDCPPWKNIGPDLLLSCWAITRTSLHNVYILEYLFIRTEQAGTYLCHLLYHSTYICPILFSPKEDGEISIFVSLKLLNYSPVSYTRFGTKNAKILRIYKGLRLYPCSNFGYRRIVLHIVYTHCALFKGCIWQ